MGLFLMNGLNGLQMEVSNYSLTGMIIQVMNLGNHIAITDPWDERYTYLHLLHLVDFYGKLV